MRVVIDSNCLRADELRLFLGASLSNLAVLTDYAWMEAYKGDAVLSICKSLAILADYPSQVILLRGTRAVTALDCRAPGIANRMILPKSTGEFEKTARAVRQAEMGDCATAKQILAHGRAAMKHLAKVRDDASQLLPVLAGVSNNFSREEIRGFRKKAPVSHDVFQKIMNVTNTLCNSLFQAHPQKIKYPSQKSRYNTFIFRYSLASVLYLIEWIKEGSTLEKTGEKMLNDLVDLNFATYATYFNGVMSHDKKLNQTYWELRHILQILNARINEDYQEAFMTQLGKSMQEIH